MSVALVTGSTGLVGSETARFFAGQGYEIVGLDNDMRAVFFGQSASTRWNRAALERDIGKYRHFSTDIRDQEALAAIFRQYGPRIEVVIHAAAQPSHDWAAIDPITDFAVNAQGTLYLLECVRRFCPEAVFIYVSTNKVYGDTPNILPLNELPTRWEIDPSHRFCDGIDETMPIDQSMHSLFGVSKAAADLLVQEYGRYFGIRSACFRGGCLTGPGHSGAPLHGFLSYLLKCAVSGQAYRVLGYKGKQVRDNLHSADLVRAFWCFARAPRVGEVYNIGGSRVSNCSVMEAIEIAQELVGTEMDYEYVSENRKGDHIWWISDVGKFRAHYPEWSVEYDVRRTCEEIVELNTDRWLDVAQPVGVSTTGPAR